MTDRSEREKRLEEHLRQADDIITKMLRGEAVYQTVDVHSWQTVFRALLNGDKP